MNTDPVPVTRQRVPGGPRRSGPADATTRLPTGRRDAPPRDPRTPAEADDLRQALRGRLAGWQRVRTGREVLPDQLQQLFIDPSGRTQKPPTRVGFFSPV